MPSTLNALWATTIGGYILYSMSAPSLPTRLSLLFLVVLLLPPIRAQQDFSNPYSFTAFAGASNAGNINGTGDSASFWAPSGIALDPSGNIYVADTNNHTIRRITTAGIVSTFAGLSGAPGSNDGTGAAARFNFPRDVAVDRNGNVFVADSLNNTIRKITPDGIVTTLAGLAGVRGGSDGTGANARLAIPQYLAVDGAGNLYVVDGVGVVIRRITPDGTVSTLGTLTYQATGIVADGSGNVYLTARQQILKLAANGVVVPFAGSGNQGIVDGFAGQAQFSNPEGIAMDSTGNFYVVDQPFPVSNHVIRKITSTGVVTTLPYSNFVREGPNGPIPYNLKIDTAGNVLVADSYDNVIRRITPAGAVASVAGIGYYAAQGNNDGNGSAARFQLGVASPTIGPSGEIYVADPGNHTIRKITRNGAVTTVAGAAGISGNADGNVGDARFYAPSALAVDGAGNIYVGDTGNDTIRKITPAGIVSTLAGMPGQYGSADGQGNAARFFSPYGLAVDTDGVVYVADTNNNAIRAISPTGLVSTLAGSGAGLYRPQAIAVDGGGNLYVADTGFNRILKVTRSGVITPIAGAQYSPGSNDGSVVTAEFDKPAGIAVDNVGNIYVADTLNQSIRRITPNGTVATLGGRGYLYSGGSDGVGGHVTFDDPNGVTVDGQGAIYVTSGTVVRKGVPTASPSITVQPTSLIVTAGDNVQFSVTATGAPAPNYQWYFNGGLFSGATGSTLSFSNARVADAGDYTVVVSSEVGSVSSNKATLTVNAAPSQPPPSGNTGGAPPPTGGGSGSGGGGGGGAVSPYFLGALSALALLRVQRKRLKKGNGRLSHEH